MELKIRCDILYKEIWYKIEKSFHPISIFQHYCLRVGKCRLPLDIKLCIVSWLISYIVK